MTSDRDYRPTTDANWGSPGLPTRLRVKITTLLGAEPLKPFDCLVMKPKAIPADFFDVSHPNIRDADALLWEETGETIKGVWYGLPSGDTLSAGTYGWIVYYYGRWFLTEAECR